MKNVLPPFQLPASCTLTQKIPQARFKRKKKKKKPTFSCKPALSPAYKSSQAEPAPRLVERPFLSSLLPPLCSSISLIKSVWKFLWGFLSVYILGSARAPMLVTPGEAMLRNSDWQARQPIAKSRMQEWVSGLRLAPREEEGRRQRRRRIKAAFQTQRVPRQQES